MTKRVSVNTKASKSQKRSEAQKRAAKKRPQTWKPGQSANPAGAPRRGESWAELIKRITDMTAPEAAEMSLELSKKLLKLGDGITLKQAIILRAVGQMIFEPDARLLVAVMDRAEGKVSQPIEHTWREQLISLGVDADDAMEQTVGKVEPKLLNAPDVIVLPQSADLQTADNNDDTPHATGTTE